MSTLTPTSRRALRSAVLPRLCLALALLVAALMARPAGAQSSADRDEAAIKTYRLTRARVDAWAKASLEVAKAAKARAEAGDSTADDENDDEASANESLDEVAARLNKHPEIRRALRSAGLTAREYTIMSLVLMQAMMADQMMRQYPNMKRPDINQANLAFVQANRAYLETRMSELKAAGYGAQ